MGSGVTLLSYPRCTVCNLVGGNVLSVPPRTSNNRGRFPCIVKWLVLYEFLIARFIPNRLTGQSRELALPLTAVLVLLSLISVCVLVQAPIASSATCGRLW